MNRSTGKATVSQFTSFQGLQDRIPRISEAQNTTFSLNNEVLDNKGGINVANIGSIHEWTSEVFLR